MHRAYFQVPGSPECFFIKVTNLSRDRDIEITHIWFETNPQVHVLNPERPLHAPVRPGQTFETWKPVAEVPDAPNVLRLGRVHLSNGKTIATRPYEDVPPQGTVAGGGSWSLRP
jgi:hypothetical protein